MRAVQLKDRLVPASDDMYVSGPVVVRIYRHAQTSQPEDSGHACQNSKPNRLAQSLKEQVTCKVTPIP